MKRKSGFRNYEELEQETRELARMNDDLLSVIRRFQRASGLRPAGGSDNVTPEMLAEWAAAKRTRVRVLEARIRKLTGPRIGTKHVRVVPGSRSVVIEARQRFKANIRKRQRRSRKCESE